MRYNIIDGRVQDSLLIDAPYDTRSDALADIQNGVTHNCEHCDLEACKPKHSVKHSVKLVKVHSQSRDSSLDMVVEVNGQSYEFAIRFTGDSNDLKLTILKDPSWWHVKTDTFVYPSD